MSQYMQTSYNIFRSVFNKPNINTQTYDFSRFDLISKLPNAPYYNTINFIPTIHKTPEAPQSGLYFNKKIGCADDMVYHTSQEFNSSENIKNSVEYKALGFSDRLQEVMMQSAKNPLCAKAKYIVFTSNLLGAKYGNSIIGVFENEHANIDPNMRIEYEIYTTV
jgi:hypothetical protein